MKTKKTIFWTLSIVTAMGFFPALQADADSKPSDSWKKTVPYQMIFRENLETDPEPETKPMPPKKVAAKKKEGLWKKVFKKEPNTSPKVTQPVKAQTKDKSVSAGEYFSNFFKKKDQKTKAKKEKVKTAKKTISKPFNWNRIFGKKDKKQDQANTTVSQSNPKPESILKQKQEVSANIPGRTELPPLFAEDQKGPIAQSDSFQKPEVHKMLRFGDEVIRIFDSGLEPVEVSELRKFRDQK